MGENVMVIIDIYGARAILLLFCVHQYTELECHTSYVVNSIARKNIDDNIMV